LQKRTPSSSLKSHTVDYLRHQTHSFDYTRDVLTQLFGQIEEELASLGGNKALEAIMEALGVPEDGG
jgi:geranylgeranyl diphosphate synthase type 3